MTGCRDIRPELGGYVLGALEPDEAAEVRRHIDGCARCASEHASLMELPGLLDLAQGIDAAAGPAPAVEERVLDSVARAPRTRRGRPRPLAWLRRPRRPLVIAAVGLACAAIGAGAAVLAVGGSGEEQGTMPNYQVVMQPTAAIPGANARAALERVPGGTTVLLWARGLPGNSDTVYEVLCDKGNYSLSAGTFRADREGRANLTLTTAMRMGEYDRIRIVRHGWDPSTRKASQTNVLTAKLS
jgi:hypothetical protein